MTNSNGNSMAAELLAVSAPAYAAYASNRLLEKVPEAKLELGETAFNHWKDHYCERIRELSVAIAENESVLFVSRIGWSRAAFVARSVPEQLLRESLVCLSEVLQEELPQFCGDVPREFIAEAIRSIDETDHSSSELQGGDAVSKLALQYLTSVLEGKSSDAVKLIVKARDNGVPLPDLYQALMTAQFEVGRMWHHAEVNIAEEHFVTFTTQRAMSVLAFHADKQEPNGLTVISAAVATNAHDVGIRAVSDFFEFAGWRAVCLGGDLPARDIAEAVSWLDASLVLLSASLSTHVTALRETIEAIRGAVPECKIMIGGAAFTEATDLWQQLGADGYAATPEEAVIVGTRLVSG